jgi:hypothetical protein
MKELSYERMEELQGGSFSYDFICGMTTGGIGTIWGTWAGGIAAAFGVATLGAGALAIGVTIVASAALDALIC